MSDIIKLNIKSKKMKAFVSDGTESTGVFTELPYVLEKEKLHQAHIHELENEYNKGFEDGKNKITEILERKHSDELLEQSKDFYTIISTFEEKMKVFENNFHTLVIKVSEKIAEKILQNELESSSIIEKTLDENLRKIIGANEIIIKLNPKDFELIQKSSKEYLQSSTITKTRFESNSGIQIGGCLVESEIGNIDARIESQLKEIIKSLENSFTKVEIE